MHTAQTPQASDQTRSSDHQNTLSSPKIASDDQILCSSESTSNSHILLSKIRALASNLPSTVELGTTANSWASLFVGTGAIDKDYIAAFGLMAEPDPDEDWEVCNRSIHKCFDYGITKEDLATRIVRGPMGVLALCGFLDFMKKRNVDFAPLHERLVLLSEALYERYGFFFRCFTQICSKISILISEEPACQKIGPPRCLGRTGLIPTFQQLAPPPPTPFLHMMTTTMTLTLKERSSPQISHLPCHHPRTAKNPPSTSRLMMVPTSLSRSDQRRFRRLTTPIQNTITGYLDLTGMIHCQHAVNSNHTTRVPSATKI